MNFKLLPKDILIKLVLNLDLPTIFEITRINKQFNRLICENEMFWMNKFYNDYGKYSKIEESWKEFYKYVTIIEPNDLLWMGVEKNILSYVSVALKRGANIDEGKLFGDMFHYPLSKASEHGYLEIVKYLVNNKANVHIGHNISLLLSIEHKHLETEKYLKEQGANIYVASLNYGFLQAKQNYAKEEINMAAELLLRILPIILTKINT